MQMLTRGQYSDALSHFHAAVDADPANYMSYYKRATVFLALSRSRPALADLDKVIQLKSDFGAARMQRGSTLLKMGRLDEAHIELEKILSKDPSNEEATRMYTSIEPLQKTIQEIQDFISYKNFQPALDRLTEIVEHIPWDAKLREMRADAYLGVGNTMNAISEMRAMTKLTNDNTEGFFKLSTMHYQLGEGDESLQQIRECLKLDPEHKDCHPFYKKVKKVVKFLTSAQEAQTSQDWEECVTAANKVLKNEPKIEAIRFHGYDKLCNCHLQDGLDVDQSRQACDAALRIREEPKILCDRAEAYLAEEMYDEAVNDYRRALELDENFGPAKEGLETAEKRILTKHTENWLKSGIQITSKMKKKRKKLKRNLWTSLLPKRYCLMKKCARNLIRVKILWMLKQKANAKGRDILSHFQEDTHLEEMGAISN